MKSIEIAINGVRIDRARVWPSKDGKHLVVTLHRFTGYTTRVLLDLEQAAKLSSALNEALAHQITKHINPKPS